MCIQLTIVRNRWKCLHYNSKWHWFWQIREHKTGLKSL